jgi:hypothetical protein
VQRFVGFAILAGIFTALFFLIRDFLDNPTASERELANPAAQFAPDTSSSSPRTPRTAAPAAPVDLLAGEERGFRVVEKVHHRARTFFHQTQRDASNRPLTLQVPARHLIVATGQRTGRRFVFEIPEDVFHRITIDFVISPERARTLTVLPDAAEPAPPDGYGISAPRPPSSL